MAWASSALTASGFSIMTGMPCRAHDLHHSAVIVSVGVRQNRLRVRLLQHVFQVGKHQTSVEVELRGVARRELLVWLGDSNDLDVGPMQ